MNPYTSRLLRGDQIPGSHYLRAYCKSCDRPLKVADATKVYQCLACSLRHRGLAERLLAAQRKWAQELEAQGE